MIVSPGLQAALFSHSRMQDSVTVERLLTILASTDLLPAPVVPLQPPPFAAHSAAAQAAAEHSAFENKSFAVLELFKLVVLLINRGSLSSFSLFALLKGDADFGRQTSSPLLTVSFAINRS